MCSEAIVPISNTVAEGSVRQHAPTPAPWADSTLFWTAIPYTLQPAGLAHMFRGAPPEVIKEFGEDRDAFRANIPRMRGPEARAAFGLYLERLEEMLGSQAFILGAQPSIADFSFYHCLWFVFRGGPTAQIFEPFRRIEAWRERIRAFGHGSHDELDSGAAVAIARGVAPTGLGGDEATISTASHWVGRW